MHNAGNSVAASFQFFIGSSKELDIKTNTASKVASVYFDNKLPLCCTVSAFSILEFSDNA